MNVVVLIRLDSRIDMSTFSRVSSPHYLVISSSMSIFLLIRLPASHLGKRGIVTVSGFAFSLATWMFMANKKRRIGLLPK